MVTKHCVVCGEPKAGETLCERHRLSLLATGESGFTWLARQVRANERRRYRELLRAGVDALAALNGGDHFAARNILAGAILNAKARRSR